jgi:hypothetical protein
MRRKRKLNSSNKQMFLLPKLRSQRLRLKQRGRLRNKLNKIKRMLIRRLLKMPSRPPLLIRRRQPLMKLMMSQLLMRNLRPKRK